MRVNVKFHLFGSLHLPQQCQNNDLNAISFNGHFTTYFFLWSRQCVEFVVFFGPKSHNQKMRVKVYEIGESSWFTMRLL